MPAGGTRTCLHLAVWAVGLTLVVQALTATPPEGARGAREWKRPILPPLTTRPAAECDAALKRIEERSRSIRSLAADFVQEIYAPVFDERDTRLGSLKLLKPRFFRVDWTQPLPPEAVVYDGRFFWEIKHGSKQVIRWTVAKKRPLPQDRPRLDAGPFKFLAGIKAAEIKKDYLVALVDAPGEKGVYRFVLVPLKPRERTEFRRLDVWMSKKNLLPLIIRFTKPNREVETWTLKNLKVNEGVSERDFRVRVPHRWKLITDPA